MFIFPPPLRWRNKKPHSWYETKKPGMLINSGMPIDRTSVKHTYTAPYNTWYWPYYLEIEPGKKLLDALFHCGVWFNMPHKITLMHRPSDSSPMVVKVWYIPQGFWQWRILTHSGKLLWKTGSKKCKSWA